MIIKYIPLQQGLRQLEKTTPLSYFLIIKYIPLQQGLRLLPKLLQLPGQITDY